MKVFNHCVVEGNLLTAQAELTCLECMAAAYDDENVDTPPPLFWFGLSMILKHIEDEVKDAYDEVTGKNKEE